MALYNTTRHLEGCMCMGCYNWYTYARRDNLTGRCRRCEEPIDTHRLTKDGAIAACPAPRKVPA
jgi:hypothetical protein